MAALTFLIYRKTIVVKLKQGSRVKAQYIFDSMVTIQVSRRSVYRVANGEALELES